MITRDQIVATAREWLDVPWRHQGRDREGVDCGGLLIVVARALGVSDYEPPAYGRQPTAGVFLTHLEMFGGVRIPIGQADAGDIIAFRAGPFPCHCGISAGKRGDVGWIIHASTSVRKVAEEPLTRQLMAARVAAFRFPGVAADG
jgi:cell wall-associated NlpC family hydrolase